jgi:hypothetical protein
MRAYAHAYVLLVCGMTAWWWYDHGRGELAIIYALAAFSAGFWLEKK